MSVTVTTGPLVVATTQDGTGAQVQTISPTYLSSANEPIAVATTTPVMVTDEDRAAIARAQLVEACVLSELVYALVKTEVEPLESIRSKYRQLLAGLVSNGP